MGWPLTLTLVTAIAVVLHWLLPPRWRHVFVAAVSICVLGAYEPASIAALAAFSLAVHALARRSRASVSGERGRRLTLGIVALALGYLIACKYLPPLFSASPVLPLGISYFTFKLVHYAIEVRRDNVGEHGLDRFLAYVFLFPAFVAGPIERFDHFTSAREERWTLEGTVAGSTRIVHGLIKKYVFAAMLLDLRSRVVGGAGFTAFVERAGSLDAWSYCVLTFLHVYLDFSAYTDMAIGGSRLLGFRILENFRWPVLARSIGDFWTRWHMTLAGWCRSYVYLPAIGLTRNPYVAAYATFVAIGLWHAGSASYLCWGLYHGTGVAVHQTWRRRRRHAPGEASPRPAWLTRVLATAATFLFVSASFALSAGDRGGGVALGLRLFGKLFFPAGDAAG